jgi:hypothetical protein
VHVEDNAETDETEDDEEDDEEDNTSDNEVEVEEEIDDNGNDKEPAIEENRDNVESAEKQSCQSASSKLSEANDNDSLADDYNGNSLAAIVVTCLQHDKDNNNAVEDVIVSEDDNAGNGDDDRSVDKDHDRSVEKPAELDTPNHEEESEEDDDIETSSLSSDLEWYQDYVRGLKGRR